MASIIVRVFVIVGPLIQAVRVMPESENEMIGGEDSNNLRPELLGRPLFKPRVQDPDAMLTEALLLSVCIVNISVAATGVYWLSGLPRGLLLLLCTTVSAAIGYVQLAAILGCILAASLVQDLLWLSIRDVSEERIAALVSADKVSKSCDATDNMLLNVLLGFPEMQMKFHHVAHILPDFADVPSDTDGNVWLQRPDLREEEELHIPSGLDVSGVADASVVTKSDIEHWLKEQDVGNRGLWCLNTDSQSNNLATDIIRCAKEIGSTSAKDTAEKELLESITIGDWNKVAARVAVFLRLDKDKDGRMAYSEAQPFLAEHVKLRNQKQAVLAQAGGLDAQEISSLPKQSEADTAAGK